MTNRPEIKIKYPNDWGPIDTYYGARTVNGENSNYTLPHTTEIKEQNDVVIYSNRPPIKIEDDGTISGNLEGGAVRVIAASRPRIWIGPDPTPIKDKVWGNMSEEDRHKLNGPINSPSLNGITVYTFPVPESLHNQHYAAFANAVIWPVMHSMDPETFFNPVSQHISEKQLDLPAFPFSNSYHFPFSSKSVSSAYEGYKAYNQLANDAINQLKKTEIIKPNDMLWIHDYQCVNVEGDAFSRHTPFPTLGYLKQVIFSDGESLIKTEFFTDYMKNYVKHNLVNFQRPSDMKNFMETLAFTDKDFIKNNQELIENGIMDDKGTVSHQYAVGDKVNISAFGHKLQLMNIPVGISQEENLQEAKENEGLNITSIDPARLKLVGIDAKKIKPSRKSNGSSIGMTIQFGDRHDIQVPINLDRTEFFSAPTAPSERITVKDVLGDALNDGHKIFFSVHRNDYTKNTLEKAEAADRYLTELSEKSPEAAKKIHFVFFISPTRPGVAGYDQYENRVFEKLKGLREKFGNSIIAFPQNIDHRDVMGILRHKNVICLLGAGLNDGHDLTLREAVDSRADTFGETHPMSLITTEGVGASDILGGTEKNPGAFVIKTSKAIGNMSDFLASEMSNLFKTIVSLHETDEGKAKLRDRYNVMKEASKLYNASYYFKNISENTLSFQEYLRNQLNDAKSRGHDENDIPRVNLDGDIIHKGQVFDPRLNGPDL